MGVHKWRELGRPYPLEGVPAPAPESVADAREILRRHNIKVY
jgi:pyruvate formate lyase activating enzyme